MFFVPRNTPKWIQRRPSGRPQGQPQEDPQEDPQEYPQEYTQEYPQEYPQEDLQENLQQDPKKATQENPRKILGSSKNKTRQSFCDIIDSLHCMYLLHIWKTLLWAGYTFGMN